MTTYSSMPGLGPPKAGGNVQPGATGQPMAPPAPPPPPRYVGWPGTSRQPLSASMAGPGSLETGIATASSQFLFLPPLPERGAVWYTQPLGGIACVVVAAGLLMKGAYDPEDEEGSKWKLMTNMVLAGIAVLCLLFILFEEPADQIQRSKANCEPIPPEIVQRMYLPDATDQLASLAKNIPGPENHPTLGSYCTRCFVWRPPSRAGRGISHHCSICQRCYTGFDHHCGVLGRCIVRSNLFCFYLLIALLPLGLVVDVMPNKPPWQWFGAADEDSQPAVPYHGPGGQGWLENVSDNETLLLQTIAPDLLAK